MAERTRPQQIRLGLIGTGIASTILHWPALSQMPDRFAITAFANRTRARAEEFASLAGLSMDNYHADYRDLLRRDDVDAVLVAVPIMQLLPITADSLEAGKHVISEKPTGGDLAQGRAFLALAERYPRQKVLVAENFFYRDDMRLARSLIDSGSIGQPELIYRRAFGRMVPEPGKYGSTPWRMAPEHRGGHLLDGGVHHISEIRLYGGDFQRVSADTREVNPTIGGLTSAHVSFRLVGGASGTYSMGTLAVPLVEPVDDCHVYGSEGTLSVDRGTVRLLRADGAREEYALENMDGGYYNEFVNFHDAVVHGEPIVGDIAQSYKNLLVMLSVFDSAEEGRWCEVPAGPDGSPAKAVPLWKPREARGLFDGLPVRVSRVAG